MGKICRCHESVVSVADIAVLLRRQMLVILDQVRMSGQEKLTGMTAFAAIVYRGVDVTEECVQCEAATIGGVMALAAFSLRGYVICTFWPGDAGSMAGCAIAVHDTVIVHKRVGECTETIVDDVAGSAVKFSCYMPGVFTFADGAVMACQAVTGVCSAVVKGHICEAGSHVAVGTVLVAWAGRYVVRQFSDTDHIVMTCVAAGRDTGMVIGAGTECARGMAGAAIFAAWHMLVERGAEREAARRPGAVSNMTGNTAIADDAGMIDAEGRVEALCIVARPTI